MSSNDPKYPRLLSLEKAARYYNVDPNELREAIGVGALQLVVRRQYRLSSHAIEQWLATRRISGRPVARASVNRVL